MLRTLREITYDLMVTVLRIGVCMLIASLGVAWVVLLSVYLGRNVVSLIFGCLK